MRLLVVSRCTPYQSPDVLDANEGVPGPLIEGVANYLADRCYDLEHVIHNLGLRTMVPTGRWLIFAYCGGRRAVVAMDDPSSEPQAKALLSNA